MRSVRDVFRSPLRTRVARRMALLFIGCAIVPLVGLGWITVSRTSAEIDQQARTRLQYEAKAASRQIFERLNLMQHAMGVLGAMVTTGHDGEDLFGDLDSFFDHPPTDVSLIRPDGTNVPLRGALTIEPLTEPQRLHLDSAFGALIVRAHLSGGRFGHAMLVRAASGGTGSIAVGLSVRTLLGSDDAALPPQASLCMVADERVSCLGPSPADLSARLSTLAPDTDHQVETTAGSYFLRTRTLPLRSLYAAEPWVITMARPASLIRAPIRRFQWDFWMVLAFSALGVTWLALGQVRRQLRPLALLTAAVHRFARRDFDTPVGVRTNDEFDELAIAFGEMSRELRDRFAELEAFSEGTLVALGRTIDAKSSWTAGHSERVTRMAVAIGREMQLSDQDIQNLARGGLVHDIGKLATPREILDKPARLTPEEERILRAHPLDGVHILDPIAAFRPLLPIVAQHHERWDGAGYPHGLAGTGISRVARVLTVADVFDAMSSDRPYRKGLPLAVVVAHLRAGAGTQFDPEVVEACLRFLLRAHPTLGLERPA